METCFHYYATLAATFAAGYEDPDECHNIAYAAQFVDENKRDFAKEKTMKLSDGSFIKWTPMPSMESAGQTGTHLHYDRHHTMWQIFHFVPRCEILDSHHKPATKHAALPLTAAAIQMVNDNIKSCQSFEGDNSETYKQLLTGLTMHVFADTWAHQDFSGRNNFDTNEINGRDFKLFSLKAPDKKQRGNSVFGLCRNSKEAWAPTAMSETVSRNVMLAKNTTMGHGQLGHFPDYPWAVYEYTTSGFGVVTRNNPLEYTQAWVYLVQALKCFKNGTEFKPEAEDNSPVSADIESEFMKACIKCCPFNGDENYKHDFRNDQYHENLRRRCQSFIDFMKSEYNAMYETTLNKAKELRNNTTNIDEEFPFQIKGEETWINNSKSLGQRRREGTKVIYLDGDAYKMSNYFIFNETAKIHFDNLSKNLRGKGIEVEENIAYGTVNALRSEITRIKLKDAVQEPWRVEVAIYLEKCLKSNKSSKKAQILSSLVTKAKESQYPQEFQAFLSETIKNNEAVLDKRGGLMNGLKNLGLAHHSNTYEQLTRLNQRLDVYKVELENQIFDAADGGQADENLFDKLAKLRLS